MWSHGQQNYHEPPPSGQQLLFSQKQQQTQPTGLHLFPVQVGPPTTYALHMKNAFVAVLIFQFLMTIVRCLEEKFRSIPIAVIMGLGVVVGFFAWKENMNITYICWWTIFSFAGLVGGIIVAITSFAVQVSTITVLCVIPLSCFCGVVLGWWLYQDYEEEYQTSDLISSWLRYFGVLPDHTSTMMHGAVGAGAAAATFPGFFGQVGGPAQPYGSADLAAAKGTANQYWAGAQDQGRHWWNQGSAQAAGMQAQAADQGRHWWNQGSAQAAGMQGQAARQLNSAQGQAGERFAFFRGTADNQYNSMQDHAARKHGDMQGAKDKAAGYAHAAQVQAARGATAAKDGFMEGFIGGMQPVLDAVGPAPPPGPPADVHRDPFLLSK
mmetsp:Transcript_89424/g.164017  ORF Transcript_89424/g.164017 Transcript_89424/m.164017 type:complete len:380 (+) Transcript_89424:134-1273(+)